MSDDDAAAARREWHERRTAAVSGPHGPPAATGSHRLPEAGTGHPEGRIPAVPGRRRPTGGGVPSSVVAGDGRAPDGDPFAGEVVRVADGGGPAGSRISAGDVRLVVIRREGERAVRARDPDPPARRAFAGIGAAAHAPVPAPPGRFAPCGAERTVQVANADGRGRGPGPRGGSMFPYEGGPSARQVSGGGDDRRPRAVSGGVAGGRAGRRSRFPRPGIPAADGSAAGDLDRAPLPPRAFSEHFVRPFPLPGNTRPFAGGAGGRRPKDALVA
ncbi:hypothetical protein [Streptomyces sp. NPDC057939]|uniref:hypothetical protein n=1 Tax=Streptomyces sp. NPDC057939 TaxID=3346284 RepID=UPI0036EC519C